MTTAEERPPTDIRPRIGQRGTVTRPQNGHVPPSDPLAEAAVLGACLLTKHALTLAAEIVAPDDFYKPAHGHIFDALTRLHARGAGSDPTTVASELRLAGLLDTLDGGPHYLITLQAGTPSTSNIETYARSVHDAAVARRLLGALGEATERAYAQDIAGATTHLQRAFVEAETCSGTLIEWEDVAAAVRGDIPPILPAYLTRTDKHALLYPGLTHWLMGEPGKGKTWVALHAVAERIRAGANVIYLDWEGNKRIIGDRLATLGLTAEAVDEHLRYWRPTTLDRAKVAALTTTIADQHVELAVCDGVAKALARQGLNEDKAPDVLAWLELLVNPIADAGAAVLMLDHVAKDRDTRGTWARGSGAKLGEVSGAAWIIRPREAFTRDRPGRFDLVQAKDREGHLGADGTVVATFTCTPRHDGHQLDIRVDPPIGGGTTPTGQFRPTALMQNVSLALEQTPDGMSKRALQRVVGGRAKYVQDAISALIEEGHIVVSNISGQHHCTLANRYRETDEQPPEPAGSETDNTARYDPDEMF